MSAIIVKLFFAHTHTHTKDAIMPSSAMISSSLAVVALLMIAVCVDASKVLQCQGELN